MSRVLSFAAALFALLSSTPGTAVSAQKDRAPALTAGTGTIYFTSYAKQIDVVDEATEKLIGEIPLKTGLAWTMRLSNDRTRFYVQSSDIEHFEVIDIGNRKTIDTFTLNESNRHVRPIAYDVDPQHQNLIVVARTLTKQIDRFEIGPPMFIQYDLKEHKVVKTAPWPEETEPRQYYLTLRYSPDGKLLYVFADEIEIYDTETLKKVGSWNLSLPNEPGMGRFNLGSMDETYDEPGFFTALFSTEDPVQKRKLLVVGRVDLGAKSIDFFPIGPAPGRGELSFALGGDRKHAYVLLEEIGRHEFWTIDIPGRRLQSRMEVSGRPRMAIRSSSNGKIIYIFEAGNTIDLYEAASFRYLRTIAFNADMMYGTFNVLPQGQRLPAMPPPSSR
jgi:hypothetical protein